VTAVADSSPLVILAKLDCLDFLNQVFPRVYISNEVHYEVVIVGAGLPGASEVSKAEWIEVKSVQNPAGLHSAQRKYGLGPGEMSTILLAKMEFLYSLNRFNVATSRAKTAVIVVGNPRLFEPECKTPRHMQLANAFCGFAEMARALDRSTLE